MKIVMIEDEPHARMELKRLLKKQLPEATIEAELESVEEGIEWLSEHKISTCYF